MTTIKRAFESWDAAEANGRHARRQGTARDSNPHPFLSPLFHAWDLGWEGVA